MKILTALTIVATLAASSPAVANVVHIVTFRYKAEVTAGQRDDFRRRIMALATTAERQGRPYIVSIRGGGPLSREGFDQGFQQIFLIEFKDVADRDYFVGPPYVETMDPAHRSVVDVILPHVERDAAGTITGSFVYDFEDGGE